MAVTHDTSLRRVGRNVMADLVDYLVEIGAIANHSTPGTQTVSNVGACDLRFTVVETASFKQRGTKHDIIGVAYTTSAFDPTRNTNSDYQVDS